ncbi:MAG: hypothetical protein JNK99_15665 [Candidatus Accumulibacter sp.]|nr:hypothetical protein [Accumulibacter sp.]MBL8396157.1 hypothetical protein [Accumulibacter sp.]
MNHISLCRLRLALRYRLVVEASRAGGWLYAKSWAATTVAELRQRGVA